MENMIRRLIHGGEGFSPSELEELVEFDASEPLGCDLGGEPATSFCMEDGGGSARDDDGGWAEI